MALPLRRPDTAIVFPLHSPTHSLSPSSHFGFSCLPDHMVYCGYTLVCILDSLMPWLFPTFTFSVTQFKIFIPFDPRLQSCSRKSSNLIWHNFQQVATECLQAICIQGLGSGEGNFTPIGSHTCGITEVFKSVIETEKTQITLKQGNKV